MLKLFAFLALSVVSFPAFGWSATNLGGGNWAIHCANGTAYSYSGSSAGLDVVGPALCPAGLVAPGIPDGVRASLGIARSVDYTLIRNLKETGDAGVPQARRYPPHGYPCLGCAPCPGNPSDYCDTTSQSRVFLAPWQPGRQVSPLLRLSPSEEEPMQ